MSEGICSIIGCARTRTTRGWCHSHYERFLRSGQIQKVVRPSVAERFWEKVDKDGSVPEHRPELGPCWIWTASKDGKGYGHFNIGGKVRKAHRISRELMGLPPIPEGLYPDHLCRNHACVRPDHTEAVTNRVNVLRGDGPTARHAKQTECKRGHPFDEANTFIMRDGGRRCRTCDRARNREAKRRYRARRAVQ